MYKRVSLIAGWIVFAIAAIVYFFSAERTGSLWDCGEFILGAYKLQVVHPPGAPLFLMIGRVFTWMASLFSDNPSDIAFAVNLMSGLCTAFAAAFVTWITCTLGKLALVGAQGNPDRAESLAIGGAGLVAGLTTAFATSIWFSAVEGEVYAMSTFFTTLTLWAIIKWYDLPNEARYDRWIIFAAFSTGLSIGVHLLSLLTFPALAMFYYFKKFKKHTFWGAVAAGGVGVILIAAVQFFVIVGIPKLWSVMELLTVNALGLPFHSGIIPTLLIVAGLIVLGLRYAHKTENAVLQQLIVGLTVVVIGFSSIGAVVLRANADPPINMNDPSDAMRLLPYINREQYGERALLHGPTFDARPADTEIEDRYGQVGDRYEYVNQKVSYVFSDKDKMFFPRMGDYTQNRSTLYKMWMGLDPSKPLPPGRPNQLDNLSFLFRYQIGWMYWRYFMWNFSGRQNGEQGFFPWDKSSGHWISGIDFIDNARLQYKQSDITRVMKEDKARNTYYMLPFLFGLIGLFFHARRRPEEFLGIFALFIITGIGIIIYSNQPPNEPRERDYVLAGSILTYAMWVGMAVLALFQFLRSRINLGGLPASAVATAVILMAPVLMGTQNFDDHSRRLLRGARDYAHNFLESCKPNAIIFTYGDNDTYPLWYAQEVEGIRTDVRVINLSLIAVDWYINQMRRRINDSPPVAMTIPAEAIRGKRRNQVFYANPNQEDRTMNIQDVLRFIGEDHPLSTGSGRTVDSYYPTRNTVLPVNAREVIENGILSEKDTASIVPYIPIKLDKNYMLKDELAILDILASNFGKRPIYFAVTVRPQKLMGLQDYMQLEGLAMQFVPIKSQSQTRQYGIYGSGRVAADIVHENMTRKFKWGNFDKYDLFVDHSFAPSIQSHQVVARRAAVRLLEEGKKDKAVELIDTYFEGFPDMNFPYDYRAYYMIQVYLQAGEYEKAKEHMRILANNTADELAFYSTLRDDVLESSYADEFRLAYTTKENLLRNAEQQGDEAFLEEINGMFASFNYSEEAIFKN